MPRPKRLRSWKCRPLHSCRPAGRRQTVCQLLRLIVAPLGPTRRRFAGRAPVRVAVSRCR
jgi:hypothetical protein